MFGNRPHVSVAVPAPGVPHSIQPTLDALLNQAYRDLEVLVCDHVPDPALPSIGQNYAARDTRVRCLPAVADPSPATHLIRALEMARGDYFMWNAVDDGCDPALIARCAAALDADPSLVLVYEHGRAGTPAKCPQPLAHRSAWRRLAKLLFTRRREHDSGRIHGLIRLDWLRHTNFSAHGAGMDHRVMLARLALCGRIGVIAPQPSPVPSAAASSSREQGRARGMSFSHWHALRGYFSAVRETWLAPIEKALCYAVVTAFAFVMLPMLVIDLIIAGMRAAARPLLLLRPADMEWTPRRRSMRRPRPATIRSGLTTPERPGTLRSIPDQLETLEASVTAPSRVA